MSVLQRSWPWYLIVGIASFLGLFLAVGQVPLFTESFSGAGDQLDFQAQLVMAGQTGPFGTNTHLNWPVGANPWTKPQAGVYILTWGWILVGGAGLSGMGAYVVLFGLIGAANGLATLWLFRALIGSRLPYLSAVLAFAISGAGMFGLLKLQHINVAAFFLLPVLFAVMVVASRIDKPVHPVTLAALVVAAAVSPLWWVFVALVVGVSMLPFLLWKRPRGSRKPAIFALVALVLGGLVPVLLAYFNTDRSAETTRSGLDSNVYGGHLADFLAASPLLNAHFNFTAAGVSPELSQVGIVGAFAAAIALLMLLAVRSIGLTNPETSLLYPGTLVAVLIFLLGGIGNLQAALAVLAGTESPARVWARLSIVISILGACWALIVILGLANRFGLSTRGLNWIAGPVAIVALCLWGADYAAATPTRTVWPENATPEVRAIEYLQNHSEPCAVAQLPVDSAPISRIPWAQDYQTHDTFLYRGFMPYVLAPDFYWSFGDATSSLASPTASQPTNVDDLGIASLESKGFCAVLFDKTLSEFAEVNGVELPGTNLQTSLRPDYENDRYALYLL